MLIKRLVVGPLQSNCYVVIDEASNSLAVIDPGGDASTISRVVAESGARLTHILLTHGHPDHVFSAGALQEEFPDASLLMHEQDADVMSSDIMGFITQFYDMQEYRPMRPSGYVGDGQRMAVGELELTVIHTPGHSPGSVCYIAGDVAFTGDTLFAGGIGRTDLPGGSYQQLMQSIQSKLLKLSDDTTIYPGHGPESTIGDERRENPFLPASTA